MKRVVIMGAGGRDFHDFNTVFRNDPNTIVVAFTAAQIPGIDRRTYPSALAGHLYPKGIPIVPESELADLIRRAGIDEVVLAYSDLSHADVMHKASLVLAAGADFRLIGPAASMLESSTPIVAVTAVRTGCGKSPTTRAIGRILVEHGLRVALVRHPMPYGDLTSMRVQRFASLADIDEAHPTVEEREEYETPVELGLTMYAGVDYGEVLQRAQGEADVIVWDGGNNDFPFFRPDLTIAVADPLRAGHELAYHPGETNLRLADAVVVNKVDSADPDDVARVVQSVRSVNPEAQIVFAESPVTLAPGPDLAGKRVLCIDDGPTLTHGGMSFGAAGVATRAHGGVPVDPRPYAVGSIARTLAEWPQLGNVLPAMGYSPTQLHELEATIDAADCDVVVTGTPIDLGRLITTHHPMRHATYSLKVVGGPTLEEVLEPVLERARVEVPA